MKLQTKSVVHLCVAMKLLRYPLRQLIVRVFLTAIALGLVIAALGWGRARTPWYDCGGYGDPWPTSGVSCSIKEQIGRKWIPPWEPWEPW